VSVKFVVVDFVVRPSPDGAFVAKKKKQPKKIDWEQAAHKVAKKVKATLTTGLEAFEVGTQKCSLEGALEEGFNAFAGVLVINNPSLNVVMRIEDNLRAQSKYNEEKQPLLNFKVQDSESKMYLNMQVEGFMLSGPNGGEWKPFDQWYEGAAKRLSLPR
jgi:hypothetical protein